MKTLINALLVMLALFIALAGMIMVVVGIFIFTVKFDPFYAPDFVSAALEPITWYVPVFFGSIISIIGSAILIYYSSELQRRLAPFREFMDLADPEEERLVVFKEYLETIEFEL